MIADARFRALSARLAQLWLAGERHAALAQLHLSLYEDSVRAAVATYGALNAYAVWDQAAAYREQLDWWNAADWLRGLKALPQAVLVAVDVHCSQIDPDLDSRGEEIIFAEAVYVRGYSSHEVTTDIGTDHGILVRVNVLKNPTRGFGTFQSSSRHYYMRHHWCFTEERGGIVRRVSPLRSQTAIDSLEALLQSGQPLSVALVELPKVVHKALLAPQLGVSNLWASGGLDNWEAIARAIKMAIADARQTGKHILLLPELGGSPEIWAAMREELARNPREENPIFVIGPTRHETDVHGKTRNVCRVLDALGNEVEEFRHAKVNAVSLSKQLGEFALDEAIVGGNQFSLVITPIGLLAVVICHDLSQALESSTLISTLADLPLYCLFVPSMSEKTTAHVHAARNVTLENGANVLLANQALVQFFDGDNHQAWNEGGSFWYRGHPGNRPPAIEVTRYRFKEVAGEFVLDPTRVDYDPRPNETPAAMPTKY